MIRTLATLALPLALAVGCAGSQKEADTTPDETTPPAALTAEECAAMADHMASIDPSLDKEAAAGECQTSGTRERHDCVMAAQDAAALGACGGSAEPTEPPADEPIDQPVDEAAPPADPAAGG